jgi:TolA-binding protein
MRDQFGVGGFPTLLILDEAGEEIDRLQGYIPPPQFVSAVEDAVSSTSSLGFLRKQAAESPDDVEIQYQLAETYLQRRMYEKAESQLQRVVELDPDNESGHTDSSLFYLSDIHFTRQNLGGAIESLTKLKERFPESEYAREADLMKAEILLYSGETDQAKKILAAFLETNPSHPSATQIREILAKP